MRNFEERNMTAIMRAVIQSACVRPCTDLSYHLHCNPVDVTQCESVKQARLLKSIQWLSYLRDHINIQQKKTQ